MFGHTGGMWPLMKHINSNINHFNIVHFNINHFDINYLIFYDANTDEPMRKLDSPSIGRYLGLTASINLPIGLSIH